MNMNNKSVEIGLLFSRIMIGLIFVLHGWSKFEDGISGTVGFFESIGIPGFLASVVAIIELVGGVAMILGLGTRVFLCPVCNRDGWRSVYSQSG